MIEILIATSNNHKVKEYQEMVDKMNLSIKFYSLKDENIVSNVEENGKTYQENALIKAKDLIDKTDKYIMADDSGIEFKALGEHFPGIYSHRFQIENGGNDVLNKRLIKEIPGSECKFHCSIVLITPLKEILHFEGECKGTVSSFLEGENGFGYDPIFIPLNYSHTLSYYDDDFKNEISHRGKAFKEMIKYLKKENLI